MRSTTEHQRKRKPFLALYRSVDDPRFLWLTNDFLGYLRDWKDSTTQRPGNFTQNARSRMFLSWQTYEGLQISAYSVVEATKFLLNEGVEYVLTERFCQDPLEEYFGNQGKLGRRNDDPDMKMFGYNNNTISVGDMLYELGWTSLQTRRHKGLIAMDAQEFMTPLQRRSRHVNSNAYKIPRSKTDYHMYSFFPRTIREWNSLANETVNAPNLMAFKKSLPSDQGQTKRC